jgi:membrane associated rhomboid family serine protease
MGKAIQLGGYFLLGVSCCGLFSYTAYVVPRFQYYAFWLVVVVSLLFIVCGLADDFLAEAIGVNYQTYVGGLIVSIAVVLIGSLLQWVK